MKDDFEKDFNELKDLNNQIIENEKSNQKLQSNLDWRASKFIKDYSIEKKVEPYSGLMNLLSLKIDVKQFKDLLNESNTWGGLGRLAQFEKLRKHMSGVKSDNKLENLNQKDLYDLYSKFESLDSIDYNTTQNDLFLNKKIHLDSYLIDSNMKNLLKNGHHENNKINKNAVYLVIFNKVKYNGKNVLIYNYIEYNELFVNLLYVYTMIEEKSFFFLKIIKVI